MSYIVNNLLKDENIIRISRPHWIIFSGPVIAAIFAFLFLIFGREYFYTKELIFGYPAYDLLALGSGILSLYYFLSSWITYTTSEFGITNKRVLMKTGFIRRDSLELFLERIEAIHVDQSIPGRILDYGSIVVIGTGGTKDPFFYIPDPIGFRKIVQQQIDIIEQKMQNPHGGT